MDVGPVPSMRVPEAGVQSNRCPQTPELTDTGNLTEVPGAKKMAPLSWVKALADNSC